MIIAPIPTDLVDLAHLDGDVCALSVGENVIHLRVQDLEDIRCLADPGEYPDGSAGQAVHADWEYQQTGDPAVEAELVTHIGAYDSTGKPSDIAVASEPYRAPEPGHIPNPSHLCLALTANWQTYVATMTRTQALRLINAAIREAGEAA